MIAADLIQKATNLYLSGPDASVPVNLLLERCAADFDLSAAFVRPTLAGLRAMPAAATEKFLAELQDDAQERTQWAGARARELARAAIEARFMRKLLPASGQPPITQEWVDTLTGHLLAHGHESVEWVQALRSLDESMERVLAGASATETAAIEADEAQIPATQGEAASAVEVEPPAVPDALGTLLRNARWYRVYDHQQQKMRWLRLEAFYPKHDSLAFTEFDGTNPLCMQAGRFLEDLCSGRSAPCNPDAQVRRLIQQLQKERQAA
jgi:hypothetical protein